MSVLNATVPTLLDQVKATNPDGTIASIVELLAQQNPILQDMVFKEGNLPTGERVTIRTGLPASYWRRLNQAVPPSKSTTAQVDEQSGQVINWSTVDKDVAELNGNTAQFRMQEAIPHLESLAQEAASTLFYGNSALNPEEFTGLAPRYNSLSAGNAQNVIDAGGSGSDNTSVWLIGWGLNTVYGVYPKGSKGGVSRKDYGLQVIESGGITGSVMEGYREKFEMKMGLVVADWRYAVRIANIDVSNLTANSGSQADLPNYMIKAMYRIHRLAGVKPVFYMNRTALQMLDIQRRDDVISGGGLNYADVDGKQVPYFRGVPIQLTDALLNSETRVV